jgi:hypothetical protein
MSKLEGFVHTVFNSVVKLVLSGAWISGLAIGIYGFVLFSVGVLAEFQDGWIAPNLDKYASPVSSGVSVLGTLFTVISIYAPINTRKPENQTKVLTAPIIFVACIISICLWITNEKPNDHVFNGIAMLGISIAVLRLLSQEKRPF